MRSDISNMSLFTFMLSVEGIVRVPSKDLGEKEHAIAAVAIVAGLGAGFVVMGPLSSSIGFIPTLVAPAVIGSIPCILVALVPRVRGRPRSARSTQNGAGSVLASGRLCAI
jgi:hypothetical protein